MPQSVDPLPQGHGLLEYSIERVLGQGGFGTTYLCRDGHLQKQVVIKEFTPHRLLKREPGGDLKPVKAMSEDHFREHSPGSWRRRASSRSSGIPTS